MLIISNVHPGLGSGPALVAEADLHSGPVVAEEQAVAHANDRAARCPVLASTLRYPTAISECEALPRSRMSQSAWSALAVASLVASSKAAMVA